MHGPPRHPIVPSFWPVGLAFWILGLGALGPPRTARASGYEVGYLGAVALGRAGAVVSRCDDPTCLTWNPSGLSRLGSWGIQTSVGVIRGDLRGRRAGLDPNTGRPFSEDSHRGSPTVIPFLAGGTRVTDRLTLGLGVLAPSAQGRVAFDPAGPLRHSLVSMDLWLLQYSLAAAWRPRRDLGVGLALEVSHLWKADLSQVVNGWFGDGGPRPGYDLLARLRFRGGATGRLLLGAFWHAPLRGLTLALAARPFPARIRTSGTLSTTYPGAYLGRLDAAGRLRLDLEEVSMEIPLPQTVIVGLRYRHLFREVEAFDLEVDGAWEGWSILDRQRIGLTGFLAVRPDAGPEDRHPFHDVEIPRRWRDGWSLRLGSDWTILPHRLRGRWGVSLDSAVVPEETFRLDFPSVRRWTVGGGLEARLGRFRLALSYAHVFSPKVHVRASDVRVAMPIGSCQAPWPEGPCPEEGVPPGPVIGKGSYRVSWDLWSLSLEFRPGLGKD